MVATYLAPSPDSVVKGESRMLPTLIDWLTSIRWVRGDTLLLREFPVNGRRVDLAVLTRSGSLAAFELKLGGFGRVIEQASYNRLTFDRSWVVVESVPKKQSLDEATRFGIGVLLVRGAAVNLLARPGVANVDSHLRRRAAQRMRNIGGSSV